VTPVMTWPLAMRRTVEASSAFMQTKRKRKENFVSTFAAFWLLAVHAVLQPVSPNGQTLGEI
jgi:hypothetical protein